MAIRPFSVTAQAVAEVNLTVPVVAAGTCVEQAYDPASISALKPFQSHMTVVLNAPGAVLTGASAFPSAAVISNAYVKASDGKLYIKFCNSTAADTVSTVVTFKILGL